MSHPEPESKRIIILDIIRGFALFGILLVNTPSLNTPAWMDTIDFGFQKSVYDHAVTKFIFAFAMESFYPIFAMLFGIGVAIFLSKEAHNIYKLYVRRMLFLLLIGLLHASLVWWGDILIVYAVLGLFLPFFYSWQPRNILIFIILIMFTLCGIELMQPTAENLSEQSFDTLLTYSTGSFWQITRQRIYDWVQVYFLNATPWDSLIYFLNMFAIMLLGMWAHKQKVLNMLENNFKILILTSFGIVLFTFLANILDILSPLTKLSKSIFYILLIILISRNKYMYAVLRPLANNGRMSMTNYLGFNICLSLIFYGYGLGLYGSMGPAWQMFIVVALYLIFLGFSTLWLSKFNYGPFERIWRLATYGSLAKNKKSLRNSILTQD